jgi:hypothetical protein
MSDLIRVFVGASPAQRVPFLVLTSSILRRASQAVQISALCDFDITHPMPKDPKNRPRTPFSFQRFAIPALCNYEGRAIYLDSDMIVLDDIAKLWAHDLHQYPVASTDVVESARNAVLVIDCDRAFWDLEFIVKRLDLKLSDYQSLMENLNGLGPVARTIPARWNRLDEFVPVHGNSILHYTDMRRQPWLAEGHPLQDLWIEEARHGLASLEAQELLRRAVSNRHVHAELQNLLKAPCRI